MRNRLIVAVRSAFLFLLNKAFMLTQKHIASPSARIRRQTTFFSRLNKRNPVDCCRAGVVLGPAQPPGHRGHRIANYG